MTRDELITELAALERYFDERVELCRVVIAADGTVIRRICRGSFQAPTDWQPPTLETLIATVKGRSD